MNPYRAVAITAFTGTALALALWSGIGSAAAADEPNAGPSTSAVSLLEIPGQLLRPYMEMIKTHPYGS
ncbi:hypothetical protein GCM10010278_84010 [Streptomyces melanogenes]|nr:hypothetical protein GCM10010278_84010 [Streptomyces melanogenes]